MLSLLLLAILPIHDNTLSERCDLAWVQHFYDENGRLVFDQIIFCDWLPTDRTTGRYQVRAWRLLKQDGMWPRYDWQRKCYVSAWTEDSSSSKQRVVLATEFRETWDQYDHELIERDIFPKERRRELRVK